MELCRLMRVRPAVVSDADAIAEVHVRSWQETYVGQVPQEYLDGLSIEKRAEMWERYLEDCADGAPGVLVLVDDDGGGEVVGFAALGESRDPDAGPFVGEVGAIYLRARVWDRGWGRRLMDGSLARLSEAGFMSATLWVLDTNERARRFYEAAGWCLDGTTRTEDVGGQRRIELRYRRSSLEIQP